MFPSSPNVNVSVMLRWPKIEIIAWKQTLLLFLFSEGRKPTNTNVMFSKNMKRRRKIMGTTEYLIKKEI